MKSFLPRIARWALASLLLPATAGAAPQQADARGQTDNSSNTVQRRLYVAVPGIRNYLDYGGHGLLVFDIDHGHRFLKRIPTVGLDTNGVPLNVKGICARARTPRLYISTIKQLMCLGLVSEKRHWEKTHEFGGERM